MAAKRQRTVDPARLEPLERWLASTLQATAVKVAKATLMSGGAVQENWRLDVEVTGGPRAGTHAWVLRTDAAARLSMSLDRLLELKCIEAAHAVGVPVAAPIAGSADAAIVGRPFAIQELVAGSAHGRRIVRDPETARTGPALAEALGAALARLHAIRPPRPGLEALPVPRLAAVPAEVGRLRAALDKASALRPAQEHILVWLLDNAPKPRTHVLVHGDFRTGNYMVDQGRLVAILDWEFCHWGDPREDLGWLCARCWRFGANEREAGGIASKADLLRGYNAHAKEPVAEEDIAYWEILAAARWAAIAHLQGDRFLIGGERSLELALTGLMAPELEMDALLGIEQLTKRGRP